MVIRSTRLAHAGCRHGVNLGTADKRAAAAKVAKHFLEIFSQGWDAALSVLDLETYWLRGVATVGDVVSVLEHLNRYERIAA